MLRLLRIQKSKTICFGLVVILCLCLFLIQSIKNAEAYYGLSGLGLYGSGTYGLSGLYGLGGLYGSSLYGLGGLGLMGGLYGLYGSSLYGLGGLGLMGGLYGLYGSSLYGLGGLGLMGGLYGLGGLSSLGGLGGLLGSFSLLSGLGLLSPNIQNAAPTTPTVVAEQAGTWTGTWISLVKLNAGIMNLTLIEDTLNGLLSGETNLILNKITNSIPAQVSGAFTGGTAFTLTGANTPPIVTTALLTTTTALTSYNIQLNCTLSSPTTMTGTYTLQDLVKLEIDYGNFNLTLSTPVI